MAKPQIEPKFKAPRNMEEFRDLIFKTAVAYQNGQMTLQEARAVARFYYAALRTWSLQHQERKMLGDVTPIKFTAFKYIK